jgi:hypothetical protein
MNIPMSGDMTVIHEIVEATEQCCKSLDELSSTCCMPTRSEAMNKLLSDFSDFKQETTKHPHS